MTPTGLNELRLPAEKLLHLQSALRQWVERKPCTKRELESLLGHLSHAATVVKQGRTFLQQLFPLLSLDRASHHFIRLNAGARADSRWWSAFLQDWNGTSVTTSSTEVISDASGSFGCGAFSIPHGWFLLEWPESWQLLSLLLPFGGTSGDAPAFPSSATTWQWWKY